MRFKLPYVAEVKPGFFYYRRGGRYWGRLPGKPGPAEFAREYERLNTSFGQAPAAPAIPGTFGHLVESYLAGAEYRQNLKLKTREAYRYDLDTLKSVFGTARTDDIDVTHVLALRDKLAATPGKANTLIRTMRVVFAWGIVRRMAKRNPADLKASNVKALRLGEHKPWPPAAIEIFRAQAAPHLALAMELALWTGQRQGDLIRVRWDDVRAGVLRVVQEKTGKELWVPISQPLAAILAEAPKMAVTMLVNSKGRPWARANPLAQAFGDELKRLGLTDLVFHGLRKTTAVVLAEAGCTTKQIAAITGQSDQMVEHYTRMADRSHLASAAVVKLERHLKKSQK